MADGPSWTLTLDVDPNDEPYWRVRSRPSEPDPPATSGPTEHCTGGTGFPDDSGGGSPGLPAGQTCTVGGKELGILATLPVGKDLGVSDPELFRGIWGYGCE